MRVGPVLLLSTVAIGIAAGCSTSPADDVAVGGEESALISCKDRRAAQPPPQAGDLWKTVWLPVMSSQQGILSIRERLDQAPNANEALDAFTLAQRAQINDLVSVGTILQNIADRSGAHLTPDDFRPDGTFVGAVGPSRPDPGDLRRLGWLIANIFTRAPSGIDVVATEGWKTLVVPIDEVKNNVAPLVARLQATQSPYCKPDGWGQLGSERALTIARSADVGGDKAISMVEAASWFEQTYGVTIDLGDNRTSVGASGNLSEEGSKLLIGLACLKSVLHEANDAGLGHAVTDVHVNVGICGSIDLMSNQGKGVTFTGTSVSTYMGGPPAYRIVMLSARLIAPDFRRSLCMQEDDVLKLYVPYGQNEVSECGLMNGVYRAAYYRLDPRVWTDNWSNE